MRRVVSIVAAGCLFAAVAVLFLAPQHATHDPGMPTARAWALERFLAGGRHISFRQGLFGGNFAGAYFPTLLALPAGLLALGVSPDRWWVRAPVAIAVGLASGLGLLWLVGYQLFAMLVAIPGWGALVAAVWLLVALLWSVGSLVAAAVAARRRPAEDAPEPP